MTIDAKTLWSHQPFVLAFIWEMLCILGVVGLVLMGWPEIWAVPLVVAGGAPMAVVILRLARAQRDGSADRSKDIVQ